VCRLFEDPLVSNPSVPLTVSERESNKSGVSHLDAKRLLQQRLCSSPQVSQNVKQRNSSLIKRRTSICNNKISDDRIYRTCQ